MTGSQEEYSMEKAKPLGIYKDETDEERAERLRLGRIATVGKTQSSSGEEKSSLAEIIRLGYPKRSKESLEVMVAFHQNEEGDAFLFIVLMKGRYVFDQNTGEWYYWNDHYWRADEKKEVSRRISEVVDLYGDEMVFEQEILLEALANKDEKQAKKSESLIKRLQQRISDLRTVRRQQNILKMAREGKDSLCITGREWDLNPWLLGCKNGTIDLQKGKFRPGRQEDYIRSISPVNWEGFHAQRPLWLHFIQDIMCRDDQDLSGLEIVDFLQMLFGYSITGLSTEHIYPICYGENGRNGKSTLFEVLKEVLGELAYKAPSKFLMQSAPGAASGHDTDQTMMRGKRFVWCSESNERDKIDAAKIKELTGGDTITARAAYAKKPISFEATHTMFIHTNYKPQIPPTDKALWKRLALINFRFRFLANPKPNTNEKKKDGFLKEKLREKELPGILAWLVEGCIKWQKAGRELVIPRSIRNDTETYRKDEDIIGHFIEATCVEGESKDFRVKPGELFKAYREWCQEDGHHSMARNRFYKDIDNRFGVRKKIGGTWYYEGVLLRDDWKIDL
jgi:putative DNA primase/helicase